MSMIIPLSKQDLENTIAFWQGKITADYQLMEAAYFAIYTEFDKFLNAALLHYVLGGKTADDRTIALRLNFKDNTHFKNVVGGGSNKFEINVLERFHNTQTSAKIWVELFSPQDDPFTKAIYYHTNFRNNSKVMRFLRNYIAHKSPEAKQTYVISNLNNKAFIEPYDYLKEAFTGYTQPKYDFFIEIMQEFCDLILKPIS